MTRIPLLLLCWWLIGCPALASGQIPTQPPSAYLHATQRSLPPRMEANELTPGKAPSSDLTLPAPPLPHASELRLAESHTLAAPAAVPPLVIEPQWDAPEAYGMMPQELEPYKNGFFQRLDFEGTWIDNTAAGDFSVYSLETSLTVALPAPTRESPLAITPGFGVHYFEGPPAPHVPPRVYETYVTFLWLRPIGDRLKTIWSLRPGVWSDLENVTDDSIRVLGRAAAVYDWSPGRSQVVLGVEYLDRFDINILPIGGVILTPSAWQRYELLFPVPKLAHRIDAYFDRDPFFSYEDWIYVRGEFGGDQWEYERLDGASSQFLLRDFRLILGVERKRNGGAGARIEIGYVFGRTLEFDDATPDVDGDDAVLVRGALSF